ncbi:MAG: hypothetical protein JXQ75_02255 [Phycisphaerae bacterium]|nr:hypothetical protein [Phycisphaerae bacterium]
MKPLPRHIQQLLLSEGETGMGYQVGDVTLRNGEVIKDVVFIQSGLIASVGGSEEIPFEPEEIASVHLTHNKAAVRKK